MSYQEYKDQFINTISATAYDGDQESLIIDAYIKTLEMALEKAEERADENYRAFCDVKAESDMPRRPTVWVENQALQDENEFLKRQVEQLLLMLNHGNGEILIGWMQAHDKVCNERDVLEKMMRRINEVING